VKRITALWRWQAAVGVGVGATAHRQRRNITDARAAGVLQVGHRPDPVGVEGGHIEVEYGLLRSPLRVAHPAPEKTSLFFSVP
jgi:hypothetical protein